MKCTRCKARAVIQLRQHQAAFCQGCFFAYFQKQVERAISGQRMFLAADKILVAASGGKDSLSLWDLLIKMGYSVAGFHLDLSIGDYSKRSREKAELFAHRAKAELTIVEVAGETGLAIPELASRTGRNCCAVCGTVKRYLFNRVASNKGFSVLATGHNLDDEAARLLGNTVRWQTSFLARQGPVLNEAPLFSRKVKPLFRLTEKETAAYAWLTRIDYLMEDCPLARGATSLIYKRALEVLEEASPGSKSQFYFAFLEKIRGRFQDEERLALNPCRECGQPTTAEVCAYCRLTRTR